MDIDLSFFFLKKEREQLIEQERSVLNFGNTLKQYS